MEILGKRIQNAVCQNCAGRIYYVVWQGIPNEWIHESNGIAFCPDSPVAEPEPGTIVRIDQ